MDSIKIVVPIEHYNINCIQDEEEYDDKILNEQYGLTNMFWFPNPLVNDKLISFCLKNNYSNVLEIGPGVSPFKLATTFVGFNEKMDNYINIDIDQNKLPFEDKQFDFTYCRHVLEDIQNPNFALSEIQRVSKSFFIETPSPLVEINRGVDAGKQAYKYRGYIHHRYIIWFDNFTNTIHMLPKYGFLETVLDIPENLQNKINYILNNFPVYWNTYLLCENSNDINIKMYNHLDIVQYVSLLQQAIDMTMANVNCFIYKITHI